MSGRKRRAVNAQAKSYARDADIKRDAAEMKEEPAATAADPEAPPQLGLNDLPAHFLVQVAHKLTYTEMAAFRLSCRKALDAVDHCGRTHRALDITRLVGELWPEKRKADADPHFDFLGEVDKELVKLSSWLDLDLISSIDFAGIEVLSGSQLAAAFGDAPRRNVKKLNLVGAVVGPIVYGIYRIPIDMPQWTNR